MRFCAIFLPILLAMHSADAGAQRPTASRDDCGTGPGTGFRLLSRDRPPGSELPEKGLTQTHTVAPVADDGVLRVDTELVVAEFEIRDKKGRRVSGLAQEEFQLEEDGVRQEIEVFSFGKGSRTIGRSIVLIIDYSQSQAPYIGTSVDAAKVLVDMLEPNDRMALVTDDIRLLTGFTSDKARLKAELEALRGSSLNGVFGKSRQLSALAAAVNELFEADDKRPIIILQTDGDEFGAWAYRSSSSDDCGKRALGFPQLKEMLEKAGTTVYSIIPGVRLNNPLGEDPMTSLRKDLEKIMQREARAMRSGPAAGPRSISERFLRSWMRARIRDASAIEEISALTGGSSQYLEGPEHAAEVYQRILDQMNQRYLLGYYPTNRARDGKKRTIKLTFRSGASYNVTGRTAYYAAASAPSN